MSKRLLGAFALLLAPLVALGAAPSAAAPKDSVVIDQKDFKIAGFSKSKTSVRSDTVKIRLEVKAVLVSQDKSYLRAAINLEGPEQFTPVFSKDVEKGAKNHEIELTIDQPNQKIIRVVVWLDRESGTGTPHALASDNIAFDGKAFLNRNDR
ncbi:MAG TPA: hypothetical protein VG838_15720 [Opitutaceae bacterium]|nr:hypothetical protein [Opitutaceae bacterium]